MAKFGMTSQDPEVKNISVVEECINITRRQVRTRRTEDEQEKGEVKRQ